MNVMEFTLTCTLDLIIVNSFCLLLFGVVFGREHQPVIDVNGSYLCAIDPAMVVFAAADIVGIPEGVPDVVRCGYACTGFTNCTSFNHKSSLSVIRSGGRDSSWGSVCELFTYVPRNCTKSTSYKRNLQCVHYQAAGKILSCQPVCDPKCISGCDKQQDGKCDTRCMSGWGLSDTFTCQPCGSYCASGCAVQGAGKCDTSCNFGFGIASDYTCKACGSYCTSGCALQGAGKCDSLCSIGFGIASDHTCQACGANCASGCASQGAGKCDSSCNFGFVIASDHTCQACSSYCTSGCASQGAGKCDSSCNFGFVIASDHTCQACGSNCASGCAVQGAGKCDAWCNSGFGIASDHTCQACASNCASGCAAQGAGKCDSLCNTGFDIASDQTCRANLAYTRNTIQVSTWSTNYGRYAVDGDYKTVSCTAGLTGIYAWWAVELSQAAVIRSVKVTNDADQAHDYRLNYFKVGVTNKSPTVGTALTEGTDYTLCAQYCCDVAASATAEVTCTQSSVLYRYVIIHGLRSGDAICLAEVLVFGV